MKLLAFGEILWDMYSHEGFIGGASLNFAAHYAKHNLQAYMLSSVGADPLGDASLAQLKAWGIHTDYIARLPHKETGKCLVTLDENSIPSYNLLTDVAWDYIDCQGAAGDNFDVLYFGTLALRSQTNAENLKAFIGSNHFREIFVDVNIRPPFYSEGSIRFALENATIVKISDEELPTVAGALNIPCTQNHQENARQLSRLFPNLRLLIITLGKEGSCAYDATANAFFHQGPVQTEVQSTVGAGDSFGAAFLVRYLSGTPIDQCLAYAAKVAAFVVSRYDAVPDYDPNTLA